MPTPLQTTKPGNLDPIHHGLGLVVDCETCRLLPRKHGRVAVALAQFAFHRASGQILGTLTQVEAEIEPDLYHRFDLRKFIAVLRGVEFVISTDPRQDSTFLTPLIPGLATLPWISLLRDIPWTAFGHYQPSLPRLLEFHGIASDEAPIPANEVRATLELLGRPSPHGPTYLELLLQGQRSKEARSA